MADRMQNDRREDVDRRSSNRALMVLAVIVVAALLGLMALDNWNGPNRVTTGSSPASGTTPSPTTDMTE